MIVFTCLFLVLLLPLLVTGCKMTPEKLARKVAGKMNALHSYHVKGRAEVITPDLVRVYYLEQWFKEPDLYRLDIKSEEGAKQVILGRGERVWVYHPELEDFYEINNQEGEENLLPFFLNFFWNSLITGQEVEILGVEELSRGSAYKLRIIPQRADPHWSMEKIWIGKRDLIPYLAEIYDDQGNLRKTFDFEEITLDINIGPEIFKGDSFSLLHGRIPCFFILFTFANRILSSYAE